MSAKLSEAELKEELPGIPGWEIIDGKLHREFTFPDFRVAFAFMTASAFSAEKMGHHPNWSNVYNRVDVYLITHDAGGVTEKDISLAAAMNAVAGVNP